MVNTCGTFNVIRQAVGLIGKNEPDSDNQVSQTAKLLCTARMLNLLSTDSEEW